MASGGRVDRIAAEFGVHFIDRDSTATQRSQSKARRTCQKILRQQGEAHLRLVFGLINNERNRGNWQASCFTSVSWLLLNKPGLARRPDFVEIVDRIDLGALLKCAKRTKPQSPTIAMIVLLSYEVDKAAQMRDFAA
jgi:hypothetical protein